MSIQSKEVAFERTLAWFKSHPSVAHTDENIATLFRYVKDHFAVAGEVIIDSAYLDMAYANLGAKLQHLAGPEVQTEIQKAQQQAADLLVEKKKADAAAKEEADRIFRRQKREQDQRNRQPGVSSAYSQQDSDVAQKQRDAADAQKAAKREILHRQFVSELRDANNHLVTMTDGSNRISYSRTEDARRNLREALKRKYPQFSCSPLI